MTHPHTSPNPAAGPHPTEAGSFAPEEHAGAQAQPAPLKSKGTEAGTPLELFATCPKGFEHLLAGELSSMGVQSIRALRGQVAFSGTLKDAYRVCLWSRLASRVILVLAHVAAPTSDALYESIAALPWEQHLPLDATFAVDARGTNDNLRNTQFLALRTKDAICDRMQTKLGGRPNVDARYPDINVVVRLRGARATCGIDLSGAPLFRRASSGRGTDDGLAGLRADYAAALLSQGGWHRCLRRANPTLVCTFSGSAAVLVEAASAALDRAPGAHRTQWGFGRWLGHDAQAWDELIAEADERAEQAEGRAQSLSLVVIDPRKGAAQAARQALRSSGLALEPTMLATSDALAPTLAKLGATEPDGLLATIDLSWLDADQQAREVAALALAGPIADALPRGTSISGITPTGSLDAALGLEALRCTDIIMGREEASLRGYMTGIALTAKPTVAARAKAAAEGGAPSPAAAERHANAPAPERARARATVTLKDGTTVPVLVAASDQFAARLAKVAKLRAKWARREDVSCYRVYDADLPDYAVAIDLYQASEASRGTDAHKRWLVVQEYAAPKDIDAELAHMRLLDVLAIAPRVLNVAPEDVTLRVRRRAKGGSQYADGGSATPGARGRDFTPGRRRRSWLDLEPGAHLVDEGGLVFEVNLAERLDTGIFLDHRDVRAEVREMAKNTQGSKRFLNLFAYTGTATCYAADGGAKHTTTVDLSATYLEWARRNMARNGFTGDEHEFVQADVVSWISEQRRTKNRWDLVFCDPPTFSNSKRMRNAAFDIQRDHAELLIGISRLLTANGLCLFSCNLRGFTPDTETLARYGVMIEDVTEGTIPEDFKRNAKIHHCYLVRRTPREA